MFHFAFYRININEINNIQKEISKFPKFKYASILLIHADGSPHRCCLSTILRM